MSQKLNFHVIQANLFSKIDNIAKRLRDFSESLTKIVDRLEISYIPVNEPAHISLDVRTLYDERLEGSLNTKDIHKLSELFESINTKVYHLTDIVESNQKEKPPPPKITENF